MRTEENTTQLGNLRVLAVGRFGYSRKSMTTTHISVKNIAQWESRRLMSCIAFC